MASDSGIGSVLGAIVRGVVYGPPRLARWLYRHLAYVAAALWLLGIAAFVALTIYRAGEVKRGYERALWAKEQARIAAEVLAQLEHRPVDPPDTGAPKAKGEVPAGRAEVIELMDVDEIEKARGGSDEAAREAIAGLAEEYPELDEEEGGGGSAKGAGASAEMETIEVGGGDGEKVMIRMKKGGLAGWIERNKKYRKRKLGDKETLEILAEVTGGHGTKVDIDPNSKLSPLAQIAAIRGSAALEEKESGRPTEDGNKPPEALLPGERGAPPTGRARPATGLANRATSAALPPEAPLDLRALGEAALLAILRPSAEQAAGGETENPDGGARSATGRRAAGAHKARHSPFAPLVAAGKLEVVVNQRRLILLVPGTELFDSAKAGEVGSEGQVLLKEVAAILKLFANRGVHVASPAASEPSAPAGRAAPRGEARRLSTMRVLDIARLMAEGGVDPARLSVSAEGPSFVPPGATPVPVRPHAIEVVLLPPRTGRPPAK